jgi:hypothetical protein
MAATLAYTSQAAEPRTHPDRRVSPLPFHPELDAQAAEHEWTIERIDNTGSIGAIPVFGLHASRGRAEVATATFGTRSQLDTERSCSGSCTSSTPLSGASVGGKDPRLKAGDGRTRGTLDAGRILVRCRRRPSIACSPP